jgi:hypothetical protein
MKHKETGQGKFTKDELERVLTSLVKKGILKRTRKK